MWDFTSFYDQYCFLFKKNSLERFCGQETARKFYDFTNLLTEENSHTNLTAIREIPDIIAKHYADCLLAEPFFPQSATVIDVGCGGGFPTIPLAIVRPDLKITAVDSTAKKVNFVQKAVDSMGLSNVSPVCARAESPEMQKFREHFDVATSRAMAAMPILAELTLPFIKKDGVLVAMKGAQGSRELQEATRAISLLGGKAVSDQEATLKTAAEIETRHIITVTKEKATPKQYPRNYSAITKKPL